MAVEHSSSESSSEACEATDLVVFVEEANDVKRIKLVAIGRCGELVHYMCIHNHSFLYFLSLKDSAGI